MTRKQPTCIRVFYILYYDAKGIKFWTTHIIAGETITIDYLDDAIYENGVFTILLAELGYIPLVDGKYRYYLKDYQGNICVVVDEDGKVKYKNDVNLIAILT